MKTIDIYLDFNFTQLEVEVVYKITRPEDKLNGVDAEVDIISATYKGEDVLFLPVDWDLMVREAI